MCMQDIALGRRTSLRRTYLLLDGTRQLAIGGNARRVGFVVATDGTEVRWIEPQQHNATASLSIGAFDGNTPIHNQIARIEHFGELVTGSIYLLGTAAAECSIWEMVLDDKSDEAIQEIVK